MIFITLMCKNLRSQIKKNVMINVNSIKYMVPDGSDGSQTLLNLGNDDYLIADESIQEVVMRIGDAVRKSSL